MAQDLHTPAPGRLTYWRLGIDDDPVTLTDYQWAWDEQRRLHDLIAAGQHPSTVMLLEHAPVYTAGRRTLPIERPFDGTPVIDVDRGGKITWHGPGQLVGYPLVKLPEGIYVVDFVRRVEEAIIRTIAGYGLEGVRISGRTGVWLVGDGERGERKLAAIGLRITQRVAMHGFAVNVRDDLAAFSNIIPCGIQDAEVTSLAAELATPPSVAQLASDMVPHLDELIGSFAPFTPARAWNE